MSREARTGAAGGSRFVSESFEAAHARIEAKLPVSASVGCQSSPGSAAAKSAA